MVAIGNFLFHHRNYLFPLFYAALFIPSPQIAPSFYLAAAAGLAVCLAGQAIRVGTIGLVYIIRGGSNRRIHARDLVTDGIFSHVRNPLYIGNILIIAGLGIMSNSVLFAAVFVPLFLFAYQAIVRAEEHFLHGTFGGEYETYMREVHRWVPDFRGLGKTLQSMRFRWRRVILKEYNATYIWTCGALALFMKNLHAGDPSGFDAALPSASGAFALLTISYFVVRYLKKSKKLRDV